MVYCFLIFLVTYYFVGRLSSLPDAVLSLTLEWVKVLWWFLLPLEGKPSQNLYRLTFIHSITAGYFCIRH